MVKYDTLLYPPFHTFRTANSVCSLCKISLSSLSSVFINLLIQAYSTVITKIKTTLSHSAAERLRLFQNQVLLVSIAFALCWLPRNVMLFLMFAFPSVIRVFFWSGPENYLSVRILYGVSRGPWSSWWYPFCRGMNHSRDIWRNLVGTKFLNLGF